ncbi:hypothetical protein G4G28_08045 [Massilia sp. Dwa41.01b]|uniref:hypothetical protein n=1 Tax=unclassified Massilia TaxID=2609279 RepID=UPI0016001C81|nr:MULTISPECIES: hypothetical protein [unclassified Massilia]QNA88454.1 hypothetical protein G4G28_08045 [Massilia sp. Dwa41.01b]QNA99348.1 hypothetical protein G4G31_11715 [Massilia sp. Se16.2.3]
MSKAPNYERIIPFVYAFYRTGLSPEQLRGLGTPDRGALASPLGERARQLADRFDQLLSAKEDQHVDDAQLQAMLEEAQALSKELGTRPGQG